ncbi:MAG: YbaN family protein [Candidatus Thioglobus sp.]|nr:YbaN family protein [Candidatus Thioglobus sp.]MBT6279122.1 YbaN family protein [Candidatus Thioglobus sp.]MBT6752706.1 YbaN family protein [Candidatus Thioglobus sp.]MBT7295093.1 YbaN family protein [Candidatus Thioglobus sp.]
MKKTIQKNLFISLGWLFVILAVIGVLIPILPTTPFLILALALFAKSSPKFHQMLLDHPWFGSLLRQWEKNRTVSRRIKIRASVLIALSFSVSIAVLQDNPLLQTMLILIAIICLYYIWRLKEPNRP